MGLRIEEYNIKSHTWRLLLSILLAITVLQFSTCGLGAGNVVGVMNVPSNIRSEIVNKYSDVLAGRYDVPDSLSQYVVQYDHLGTRGYYFDEFPRAVYTVSFSSGYRVISIYYPDIDRRIINSSEVSNEIKSEVQDRILSQVIKPIWRHAISKQLSDSVVYIFPNCESHIICES